MPPSLPLTTYSLQFAPPATDLKKHTERLLFIRVLEIVFRGIAAVTYVVVADRQRA